MEYAYKGNNNMTPPDPNLTVCWLETCDSCTPWTLDPELTCSADVTIKKEGKASVKISKGAAGTAKKIEALLSSPQCGPWFGGYFRANVPTKPTGWNILLKKTDETYVGITYVFMDPHTTPKFYAFIYDPEKGYGESSIVDYTNETWEWIELKIIDTTVEVWRNGSKFHTFLGWPIYPVSEIEIATRNEHKAEDIWVDYLRWSDTQEYPPTIITAKLFPFWKLKI